MGCGGQLSHSQADAVKIAPTDIQYILTPKFSDDGPNSLDVILNFKGEMDGETQLNIGGKWAGVEYSRKRFRGLSITGEEVIHSENLDQRVLDIQHKPGSEITIAYRLSEEDMRDASADIEYFYAPVLNDDVIHLIGTHALVIPFGDNRDDKRSISLTWENLPLGWKAIDTLPNDDIYSRWIVQQVIATAPSGIA